MCAPIFWGKRTHNTTFGKKRILRTDIKTSSHGEVQWREQDNLDLGLDSIQEGKANSQVHQVFMEYVIVII